MRAQAQGLSSAANRDGSATRGSVFGRVRNATRASSPSAKGSGAPSHRGRLAVLALAIAALALLAFTPLAAAKSVIGGIGTGSGGLGGQFIQFGSTPLGVAVNNSGNGAARGTVYIVDSNSRIQRFSPSGAFERTWGQDVISTTTNEQQSLLIRAVAGTYTLNFKGFTTDPIPFDASSPSIRTALQDLPSVGRNNAGAGGSFADGYTISFVGGGLNGADQPQITVDTTPVGSPPLLGTATISTIADGADSATTGGASTGFEICTVASHCKAGSTSGSTANGGQLSSPQGIAVNQSNGNVYVTESGNRRVSEFRGDGTFVRTWGWDVISRGRGTNVAQNEIQTVTLDPNITGGTFQLRYGGTAAANTSTAIDWDADASEVRTALETIAALTGNVDVTSTNPGGGVLGGPYTVEFRGALADTDAAVMTSVNTSLIGTTRTITIATLAEGTLAFEICADATGADCKQGAASTSVATNAGGGRFGFTIGHPVVDSSNNVWIPDATSRRIQAFDSSGNFIAAYGHNVDRLGGGGAVESCTSTAPGDCQAGTQGSTAGQFASNNPTQIAFDNAGNLYAIDAGNTRVQRFDPTILASVSNFGTATFPTYTTQAPERVLSTQGGTRLVFSVNNNVTGGGERQLLEIDPSDASVRDTSLVNSRLTNVGGLGVNADNGNLYASTNFQSASPRHTLILGAMLPDPVLAMRPITVNNDTGAILRGTIDPRGGLLNNCAFRYSTDGRNWNDVNVAACDSLIPTGGGQDVSANLTGLRANTRYFVRLQAARPLTPGSTQETGVRVFNTDSLPPGVSNVGAIQVADTSARLVGTIDPKNSATAYVFEYGTTPSLGSSTDPVDVGSGDTPITLSQVLGGLVPDTTYYFKLAATNDFGTTKSDSGTFHTRVDPLPLPDERGYEMVSPPDKNLGNADKATALSNPQVGVAYDGDAVAFCTGALFGEPPAQFNNFCATYVSRRNPAAERWDTTSPLPRFCARDITTAEGTVNDRLRTDFSANIDYAVQSVPESAACAIPPIDPAAPIPPTDSSDNLYRQDFTTDPFEFDLLTPETYTDPFTNIFAGEFAGASENFSHIVYTSNVNQTLPPDSPAPGDFDKIYEWDNGTLRLVSKDTGNVPFSTDSYIVLAQREAGRSSPEEAVSLSGERIFFQNETINGGCTGPACDLYMREGGVTTHHVSASECTRDCGVDSSADQFLWGTKNGDKALFASGAKLTDASTPAVSCSSSPVSEGVSCGSKLYRWNAGGAIGNKLVDLTIDKESADGTGARVIGVIGISDDADTVYFVATGQIVAGESTIGRYKLYRWRWNEGSPSIDYLGAISNSAGATNWDHIIRRVSADGRYLLIDTGTALNPVADVDSNFDTYRWSEADGWLCVSCQTPGVPSAGDVTSGGGFLEGYPGGGPPSQRSMYGTSSQDQFGMAHNSAQVINMSADGRRIFFDTPDALVPEDTNGENGCPFYGYPVMLRTCSDVYEWHDGKVNLLSTGTGQYPAFLIGADSTGEDVFFFTRNRLVGWDVDEGTDIYNARIGGGFPEPPATGAPCEGEACRGAGTPAPNVPGAASRAFEGPGNQRRVFPENCGRHSKQAQRKLAAAKKATKKGQVKRARALRKQARDLNRRATRCNRRQAS